MLSDSEPSPADPRAFKRGSEEGVSARSSFRTGGSFTSPQTHFHSLIPPRWGRKKKKRTKKKKKKKKELISFLLPQDSRFNVAVSASAAQLHADGTRPGHAQVQAEMRGRGSNGDSPHLG